MFSLTLYLSAFLESDASLFCLHVVSIEEKKAEEESFETDLIAGRLQEEVVSVTSYIIVLLV